MIIIVVLALITASGFFINRYWSDLVIGIAGACLLASILMVPIIYTDDLSFIEKYHSTKITIAAARADGLDNIENAALLNTIIETNKRIATTKFWNDSLLFGIYNLDEVAELEPLR